MGTMKMNRKTAAGIANPNLEHIGVEYPTCQNGVRRWILKKKGRRTGTLVTRYFHIDKGHFVYYSSLDSSSAIGRVKFVGAKIKVKSITMLEIECRSRSDPVYIDGFGAVSAMRVKEILNKLQSELEDVDVAPTNTSNTVPANACKELEKSDKFEKVMTKNIKEKGETSDDVSGGTVEPRPVSIKEPFKHSSASKVENTAQKDVKSAEINTSERDKNSVAQTTAAEQKRNLSLIDISLPTWTNNEVLEWLKELHYEHYAPKFKELLIDGELLLEMTDEDLKSDLDISVRLHRVKLLKSIRKILIAQ